MPSTIEQQLKNTLNKLVPFLFDLYDTYLPNESPGEKENRDNHEDISFAE